MINLIPGQNCPIQASPLTLVVSTGAPADFSAFILHENGKTYGDDDFIFYGQTRNATGSVRLIYGPQEGKFEVQPANLPLSVHKVVFAVTSDFATISSLRSLALSLTQAGADNIECKVNLDAREEKALILGEIYRYKDSWKFRFIDQGFKGGLRALAESFGVEIAEDEKPTVNLSKVTLTKTNPTIDLSKRNLKKGVYRVNLNWNQGPASRGRRLGSILGRKPTGIDLDLAAYVRLKNGAQTIVQALGNTFGSLSEPPWVRLLGDDRTGERSEGEWLEINGEKLDEISEIVIFSFIYEGVPNWNATDAKVRLEIDGQPEIETLLSEGNNKLPMCAIARIANEGGNLRVERINRYYSGHPEMDKDFGWGFVWKHGSKD